MVAATDNGVGVAECVEVSSHAAAFPLSCLQCACERAAPAVAACSSQCWQFLDCFAALCGTIPSHDQTALTQCVISNCGNSIGSASEANPVGLVLRAECWNSCSPETPVGDAGSDDGGS
jgi:hypothetical protein